MVDRLEITEPLMNVSLQTEQILGVAFFNGTAEEAVERMAEAGGVLVIPPSPALVKLNHDESYRRALQQADLVLPDSGLLANLWRLTGRRSIQKISGIDYLGHLLRRLSGLKAGGTFWIVSALPAKEKAFNFLKSSALAVTLDDFVVLSAEPAGQGNHALLLKLEERRPKDVIIALRSGVQEELGLYLRDYLLFRPSIHCVGAALGFLTGDETPIPHALERRHLGWIARLQENPAMILPRLGIALRLAVMLFRYGSEMPPLRARWADL